MTNKCKLISLDTSTSCTGWALYINGYFYAHDVINLKKEKDKELKMKNMVISILNILNTEKPEILIVEETSVARNVSAQRKLTMLLGAIYAWCVTNKCEYIAMRPTQWRSLVKDSDETLPKKREELKAWSIGRVKRDFNVDVVDDVSDAILIGRAYINMCEKLDVNNN